MTILSKIDHIGGELLSDNMIPTVLHLWLSRYFWVETIKEITKLGTFRLRDGDSFTFAGILVHRMERPYTVGFFSFVEEDIHIPIAYFDSPNVIKKFLEYNDYGQIKVYTFDVDNPREEYRMVIREKGKDEPKIFSEKSFETTTATFKEIKL